MSFGEPTDRVYDKDVIEKNAEKPTDRRQVFDIAVGECWIDADIGMIRRIEIGDRYHYAMWRYPLGVDRGQEENDES